MPCADNIKTDIMTLKTEDQKGNIVKQIFFSLKAEDMIFLPCSTLPHSSMNLQKLTSTINVYAKISLSELNCNQTKPGNQKPINFTIYIHFTK